MMMRTPAVLLLAGLLPAFVVTESSDAAARAHELLAKQVALQAPGFAAVVAVDGRIVWSEYSGFADLQARNPVTVTSRFRIGSISKSLTAACLMRLVERGVIDLDAPVQKYVPDFPVKAEGAITTRLLAGHLAGIRHHTKEEPFLNRPFPDVAAGLKLFANDPLVAPPGAKFHYSGNGWTLVSAVIESAANRDFLDCMQREVIAPLGLTHTRPDRAGAEDSERTAFYQPGANGFVAAPTVDFSYLWAGGGYLSTAEDLVKFASALLRPGYLGEESRRLMFTSQKTATGETTGYGLGWFVTQDNQGRPIWYHDGGSHGGTAVLLIRPETHTVAAILCNLSGADLNGHAMKLADLFAPPATK
ncbi:MAG TPA: serine hydrolase domain-containing protein [Lacunisphaera sp.]|nr:serine hydrolase domain-containing protein [Lacunisphaera sp.]